MSERMKAGLAVGLAILACLGMGPPTHMGIVSQPAPNEVVAVSEAPVMGSASYNLLIDSMFAEGCMGGGFGCMCPLQAASAFTGDLTMTSDPRTPPGHHAYNVAIQDWVVVFDDREVQISGTGRYDLWTDLSGESWQSMTLDLLMDGDSVHFSSGVLDGQVPDGAFPENINISLDDNAACYGFVVTLVAQCVPENPEVGEELPLF